MNSQFEIQSALSMNLKQDENKPARSFRDTKLGRIFISVYAANLIQDAYRGILGREADPDGLETYTKQLAECRDIGWLLDALARSDESWEKALTEHAPEIVRAIFAGLLGRQPDSEDLAAYSRAISGISALADVLLEVTRSSEFLDKTIAGNAAEFVNAVFVALIGREPGSEALLSYSRGLSSMHGLASLMEKLARSDESWKRTVSSRSDELVRAAFLGLLDREPDSRGLSTHRVSLSETHDLAVVLRDIIGSKEFKDRFIATLAPETIKNVFRGLLGRDPESEALESYASSLIESGDLAAILNAVTGSNEFWGKMIADRAPEVVRAIYKGLLDREPDPAGMERYVELIRESKDFGRLLSAICRSGEFVRLVSRTIKWPDPAKTFDDPCLVFIHIEKTAGTSLRNHLKACYGSRELFSEHRNALFQRSAGELSRYSVFAGHFSYDSLRYIHRRKMSVFTFVREPKERLLSLYNFWRAHEPGHPYWHWGMEKANALPVDEFFSDPMIRNHSGVWNHITWAVMGERQWRVWRDSLRTRADESAAEEFINQRIRPTIMKHLKRFLFIGIQERFDESVRKLFNILGKNPPAETRTDHSLELLMNTDPLFKSEMVKQPMTPSVAAAMDPLVRLDNIIYECAVARMDYTKKIPPCQSPEKP